MRWRTTCAVLVLCVPIVASAQDEPTPIEIAIQTCIAPGFISDGDPFEILVGLPERNCIRACKAAAKGCKDIVKTIDQCGVKFLQATIKVATEVCKGLGGTSQQCRGAKAVITPDIVWWKAQGKLERAACDADTQAFCLSRCSDVAATAEAPLPPFELQRPSRWELGAAGRIIAIDGPQ